ncbi:MAG: WecB/TagA/CpsF family glycosyltransferase [Pseudomonadota bacterium]
MDNRQLILSMKVNPVSYEETINQILKWTAQPQSRYICFSNVHMCMETFESLAFRDVVNEADLVVPDGRPIVWALQLLGVKNATQVRGPALVPKLLKLAEQQALSVGFYGGTPDALVELKKRLAHIFPKIKVTCTISPPFRALTQAEDSAFIDEINRSGTQILFVFLGCPKQEQWMAAHRDKLSCVMLGVGAALNFLTAHQKQAPPVMQKLGLEWLHRLSHEPRRLWKRYFKYNTLFLFCFFWFNVKKT